MDISIPTVSPLRQRMLDDMRMRKMAEWAASTILAAVLPHEGMLPVGWLSLIGLKFASPTTGSKVNPNIDKAEHVLNIDDCDNRPILKTARETAAFYGIDGREADEIIARAVDATSRWRVVAQRLGIGNAEIEVSAGAFRAIEGDPAPPTKRRAMSYGG